MMILLSRRWQFLTQSSLVLTLLFTTGTAVGTEPPGSPISSPPASSLEFDSLAEVESSQENSKDDQQPPQQGLVRLSKDDHAWFDLKRKLVVVDAEICQREGILEMFACPLGTKDHESVLGVRAKASVVHACLLAVGAIPGQPATWEPVYQPATGVEIDVFVAWTDEAGKRHKVRGQQLVRNTRTQHELNHPWVFAGSTFWRDEDNREHYAADWGEFICVSNFARATLDLPIESSQNNSDLLYEPFTERIPPRGTKVRLVLIPRQAVKDAAAKGDETSGS